jgi:hypothetical protein
MSVVSDAFGAQAVNSYAEAKLRVMTILFIR